MASQYILGCFTFTFRGSRTIALPLLLVVPKRAAVRITVGLARKVLRDCIATSYMIAVEHSTAGASTVFFTRSEAKSNYLELPRLHVFVAFMARVIYTVSDMVVDPCDENYAYLSLTVARYSRADALGKYMALLTLSPIYLAVAYVTLVIVQRDLQVFILGLGHLFDLVINKVLKIWFAEARPAGCVNTGFGMPSNHTQYMFFFATFAAFFLWGRVDYCPESKAGLTIALWGWATGVGYSRLYLNCHTLRQVVVGAAVGSGTGALWYLLFVKVISPVLPAVASWPISRLLHVKDYSQVPNVLAFEHANLHGGGTVRIEKQNVSKKTS